MPPPRRIKTPIAVTVARGGNHRGAEEDDPEYDQGNSQHHQPDPFASDRLQLMADHLA
jgi:hypothetical protein